VVDTFEEPLRVGRFADAVSIAIGIKDRFGTAHTVALLDGTGHVWDLTAFTSDAAGMAHAVGWAHCMSVSCRHATRMLLVSAVDDVSTVREDDIRLLQRARLVLADAGIEVVDWIQADADNVRSLTFACDESPRWTE
jgi:hypothetical protein